VLSIQIYVVVCPTYPETFIRGIAIAPFVVIFPVPVTRRVHPVTICLRYLPSPSCTASVSLPVPMRGTASVELRGLPSTCRKNFPDICILPQFLSRSDFTELSTKPLRHVGEILHVKKSELIVKTDTICTIWRRRRFMLIF